MAQDPNANKPPAHMPQCDQVRPDYKPFKWANQGCYTKCIADEIINNNNNNNLCEDDALVQIDANIASQSWRTAHWKSCIDVNNNNKPGHWLVCKGGISKPNDACANYPCKTTVIQSGSCLLDTVYWDKPKKITNKYCDNVVNDHDVHLQFEHVETIVCHFAGIGHDVVYQPLCRVKVGVRGNPNREMPKISNIQEQETENSKSKVERMKSWIKSVSSKDKKVKAQEEYFSMFSYKFIHIF